MVCIPGVAGYIGKRLIDRVLSDLIMKVGVIGLGLIGGSMAIDMKRRGFADEVLGVEAEPVNAAAAEKIFEKPVKQKIIYSFYLGEEIEV